MAENSSDFDSARKVFVGNLSLTVTQNWKLKKFFEKFGDVEKAHIVFDRKSGSSKKIAFVTFGSEEAAERAIKASETELTFYKRVLRVHPAEERKSHRDIKKFEQDQIRYAKNQLNLSDHAEIDETECAISKLNHDCLLLIFKLLDVRDLVICERVCKTWNDTVKAAWIQVRVVHMSYILQRTFGGPSDRHVLDILKRTQGGVKVLDLSCCRQLSDSLPALICQAYPLLEELDFSGTSSIFTPMVAEITARNLPHLKVLKLDGCACVDDKTMKRFTQYHTGLEMLDLSSTSVTGTALVCFTQLRCLNLTQCFKIRDKVLNNIIANNSESLEDLNISGCYLHRLDMIKMCPYLNSLDLSFIGKTMSPFEEGQSVKLDLSGASNLEKLIAKNSPSVCVVENLNLFAINCPNIRYLDLSRNWISGGDLPISILLQFPNLQYLNLSYCNVGYDYVSEQPQFSTLSQLHTLNLCGSYGIICNEKFLRDIAQNPSLHTVDISGTKSWQNTVSTSSLHQDNILLMCCIVSDDVNLSDAPTIHLIVGGSTASGIPYSSSESGRFKVDPVNNSDTTLLPLIDDIILDDDDLSDYSDEPWSDDLDYDDPTLYEEWS